MVPTFENPIIRGFNPDPTVCVVPSSTPGGSPTYYLSTSTFEYFPGCAIYRSTDIINWTLIGHALTRPSQLNLRTVEPGAGSWASTLRYRQDEKRWYLFNGVYHRYRPSSDERIFPRGFYVWTDDIDTNGSWSDPVYFDNPGFDQDVFWDDGGKSYLSTTVRIADRESASKLKDFAIHISEIDLPTGRTLTPPVCIRQSKYGVAEGSHIMKKDGYYYLFVAEGGTEAGHQEWVFRSEKGVFGPWESQGKPLWYNGPNEDVQRTGHADVFEDEQGRWWGVFLGVRPVAKEGKFIEPQLETFLVKVEWADGWPVFNDGKNIRFTTEGRDEIEQLVLQSKPEGIRWQAALDPGKDALELGWYQKNTPLKPFHSFTERPGYLRLHGGCYGLSSPEAPALLLRKQESYHEKFSATLEFKPSHKEYEAGITVWWSMYSYASIGITAVIHENQLVSTIVCRKPTGAVGKLETTYPAITFASDQQTFDASTAAQLSAAATPTTYTLKLSQGSSEWNFSFNTEDLCIMPPVGGAFTGVMFGIYSFGAWEPVLDPADFNDIMIQEQES
ncbi:glycoside hydrolase family 43 protein [Macroventuria anomochaeta]|uniref:Glycoside hydrolase family 43 protein n=1 Tax=Macroventuria anomochaeta TaxID=301207 RepID=A0ACB6RWF6_9PLEO|nr:glycoside hydrolase family 43 protein [Macroventuria anomochaeta]KAF2625750.1 glycoside hydrolase family 43 protein [Macroventuria anomochaeta]